MKVDALKSKLTKQYHISGWVGALKDLFTRVVFYVTALNFVLLAATAYHTTLRETIQSQLPWLTFPVFLGVLVVLVLISMVIEYKIVLPSTIAYLNEQGYKHQNPIRAQLDRIEKMLADMQEREKKQK